MFCFCLLNNILYYTDYDEDGNYKYLEQENLSFEKKGLNEELKKYDAKNLNDVNMYKEEFKDALNISIKVYNDRTILVIGSFYVYKDALKML